MKAFGGLGYQLRNARFEVRLVYSGFLLLAMVGMATMAGFQLHHIGLSPERIAAYYRGGDMGGQMAFAKTVRELVEVTHFHSFIFGIVYLVLAHLFIATSINANLKLWMIVVGFLALFFDLLAPWLIRFGAAGFAWLTLFAWAGEWVSFAAFIGVPLWEMWFSGEDDVDLE